MSATITGLGSGFDITSWVSQLVAVKQSSTVAPLEEKLSTLQTKSSALTSLKSKYSAFQSALQTFSNTIYNSSSDMWSKTATKSSNEAYATVSSTGSVAASQVELYIEQIATATTAKSAKSLSALSETNISDSKFVNLANGQAKAGNFSIFLNNKEYKIEIGQEDTLGDVIKQIEDKTGKLVQASINEETGDFTIQAYKEEINASGEVSYVTDESANLILGSSGDTSNFVSALKLNDKTGTHSYASSYPVSNINTSIAMNSEESGLGEIKFDNEDGTGKIFINGEEIEVSADMSINSLISKINSNSDTKVKASYDSLTNRIVLMSNQTGQSNISLASEGTNLLNVLGLTEGEGEDEIIAKDSQTLGQNAIVHINGNKVISHSNTITGESSGIANLSITVKKQTSDYSLNDKDEKSIKIDIERDYADVKSALEKVVSTYNDMYSTTKTMIASDGKIGRDSSLNSILSQMRSITSKVSDNDGIYSMLSEIGITTDKEDATTLKIDSTKLEKALNENLDSVKSLLSDGYVSEKDNGIFDSMLKTVNSVLDVEKGYFTNSADSIQSQIKSMNSRIERANDRLTAYHTRLTKQFNKMDATISNLNTQLSTFTSYIG